MKAQESLSERGTEKAVWGQHRDLKVQALKIGVIWPQAKGCRQPPEAGTGKE